MYKWHNFFLDDNQPSKMEKYLNVILEYLKILKKCANFIVLIEFYIKCCLPLFMYSSL